MGCGASSDAVKVEAYTTPTAAPRPSKDVKAVPVKDEHARASAEAGPSENAPAADVHYYCGMPRAQRNKAFLGSDPHQAGWLAGRWTSSSDDHERTDALRKLGILLTVRRALARTPRSAAPTRNAARRASARAPCGRGPALTRAYRGGRRATTACCRLPPRRACRSARSRSIA